MICKPYGTKRLKCIDLCDRYNQIEIDEKTPFECCARDTRKIGADIFTKVLYRDNFADKFLYVGLNHIGKYNVHNQHWELHDSLRDCDRLTRVKFPYL